jgi:hypothetical protein
MKNLKILLIFLFINNVSTITAQCVSSIACGAYHTTFIKVDGTIWTNGYGDLGSLGNTNDAISLIQIPLASGTNWSKISNGIYTSFAIKNDGKLFGTGYNLFGQLGINSTIEHTSVMGQIGTSTNWNELISSNSFTIALKTDSTLWGWGANGNYQMGNNTCCANRLSPGQIGTATDWKAIAAGRTNSAFALKNDGTMWCWGQNIGGLLGSNLVGGYPVPTQHNPDTNWASITLGNAHMLAIKTNGTLWAWGGGGQGQTADNFPPAYLRTEPTQIGTSTWLTVAGGSNTSFGIKTDGTLWAWGQNDAGQLGLGAITPNQFAPVQIGTDSNWVKLAVGYEHAIALKADGSLWGWGDNTYGQLGNGTTTSTLSPIQIPVSGCALATNQFNIKTEQLTLFPNPANQETTISYNTAVIPTIEVYNLLGARLEIFTPSKSVGTLQFNTSKLPTGIYIVVLKTDQSVLAQQKLVVK